MGTPIHVLIVEDSEDDTLLLVSCLRDAGYNPAFERVDTAETMKAALATQPRDIVISDYSMPSFSGSAALTLLHQSGSAGTTVTAQSTEMRLRAGIFLLQAAGK